MTDTSDLHEKMTLATSPEIWAEGGPVEGPNVLLVRHAHSVSNARGDWKTKQKKRRKES